MTESDQNSIPTESSSPKNRILDDRPKGSRWELHWKKTRGKGSTDVGRALADVHAVAYLMSVGQDARDELRRLLDDADAKSGKDPEKVWS